MEWPLLEMGQKWTWPDLGLPERKRQIWCIGHIIVHITLISALPQTVSEAELKTSPKHVLWVLSQVSECRSNYTMNTKLGANEAGWWIVFSTGVMSTQATLCSLAGERCCLAETALSGDHAVNDANVNAHAGRMPHGWIVTMLMLIS